MPFEIVRNDITRMRVDAIVNAANPTLLGGGGVDGAIHRAAGPELLAECETLGGCETGKAKVTGAYRLPCRYVIHTVGPVWQGGNRGERDLLVSCYRESLRLAEEKGCESVAFPLISAGVYGYPKDQAIKVAADTIRDFLLEHDMHVYLVVFDRNAFTISQKLYANIQAFIDDAYSGIEREQWERRSRIRKAMYSASEHMPSPSAAPEPKKKQSLFRRQVKPAAQRETAADFFVKPDAQTDADTEFCAGAAYGAAADQTEELRKYLARMDEGFRDMLLRKIDEHRMTDAECYKKANIDRKLFNKIKNQADYKPGKSTVLALAVALELPLDETGEMLGKAGFALSHSSVFDLIVKYCIRQGNYDIYEINEALFSFDQKLLGSLQ